MLKLRTRRKQIERIKEYEVMLDEALDLLNKGNRDERLDELAGRLEAYYTGPLWMKDYRDDEAGLLPKDLKKGVLSEDGIYDLLTAYARPDEEDV